jgi:hypothetical protein
VIRSPQFHLQGRRLGIVAELFDAQGGDFAASASARGEGDQQRGVAARDERVGAAVAVAGRQQPIENVSGDRPLAFALAGTARRTAVRSIGAAKGQATPRQRRSVRGAL